MSQARDFELAALHERLTEMEDTLQAIRRGDVDALVIDGAAGKQIFTLSGAEEPYRMLVEQMQEGAMTLTPDGTIAYANKAFANFIDRPLEQIIGKPLAAFLVADEQLALSDLFASALRMGTRRELLFRSANDEPRPGILSLNLLAADKSVAFSAVVTDLRAQRRTEELAAAERFARSVLEQAIDAIVVCDVAGRILHMSQAARQLAREVGGGAFNDAFPLMLATAKDEDSDPGAEVGNLIELARRGRSIQGLEVRATLPGQDDQHFLMGAGPLYDSRGLCVGCIVTLTDISERKQAEARQKLLIDELNHRVKNMLATVQSIVRHTRRTKDNVEDFHEAFMSRLMALGRAHDLLTRQVWQGAALADVARQTLAPFVAGDDGRLSIDGPAIRLSPNAAVTMSMGIHELATNAVKYGAWSGPGGRVDLKWRIEQEGGAPSLELRWVESGGPPVAAPNRHGFGSRLLQQGLVLELDGEVDIDYAKSGLICTAHLRLSEKIALQ